MKKAVIALAVLGGAYALYTQQSKSQIEPSFNIVSYDKETATGIFSFDGQNYNFGGDTKVGTIRKGDYSVTWGALYGYRIFTLFKSGKRVRQLASVK